VILLDTHAAIWLLVEPGKLSPPARAAIRTAREKGQVIACSVMSLFEIAYLVNRNRLSLNSPAPAFLSAVQEHLAVVGLTAETAIAAAQFAATMHGDPIDRLIAATAMSGDYTLITIDNKLRKSGVCRTVW
jgi:PIN domain nuclease of toxin-antitoxin system